MKQLTQWTDPDEELLLGDGSRVGYHTWCMNVMSKLNHEIPKYASLKWKGTDKVAVFVNTKLIKDKPLFSIHALEPLCKTYLGIKQEGMDYVTA